MKPIHVLELRSVRGTGGGPEKTILLGAAQADPRRVRVTVCYIRDKRDKEFLVSDRAAQLGVDYVEIVERHSLDAAIWPALRRLVRDRRIDIVHAHDYKTNLIAWLLARTEPIIALATAHGWTGHSPRERYFYYPADKRLLARFPFTIAVSGEIRAALVAVGARADRIRVILNGIDPGAFRRVPSQAAEARAELGLGAADPVIGAVGRLEPQKRFDILMRVFARLREQVNTLRLVIAGDGSSRAQLEALARDLNLGDSCLLLGHQSNVSRLHHAFTLFVQSSDYEGTSNAVLEAMALETPIVATDVGGTREMLSGSSCGLIVPPRDPDALARAIDDTLRHAEARADRVAHARRRVEHDLSFEARMAAVEQVYDELMAARSCTQVAV